MRLFPVLCLWAGVAAVTALCGCSSIDTGGKVWYKPNGTAEERDRLLAAAHVQAQQAHVAASLGTPDTSESKHQTETETTMTYMTAHGWQLVPPDQAKPLKSTPPPQAPASKTTNSSIGLDR